MADPLFSARALTYLEDVAKAHTMTVPIELPFDPDSVAPAVARRGAVSAGPEIITVWAKLEFQLPSGSTKDRIAAHILRSAIAEGRLTPDTTVVEASSGSTSISLAMFCAVLGVRFVAVMPEGVSRERLLMIRRFGGQTHLTPAAGGVIGAIGEAEAMARADETVFWPDQFNNPRNAQAHRLFTGPALLDQVPPRWIEWDGSAASAVDGFVAAVGTGGTLMGMGRAIRAANPVAVIARVRVADEAADAEQGGLASGIAGVADCLSGVLSGPELGMPEDIMVTRAEAVAATRWLCSRGFPVGPSSGLNFEGAKRLARVLGPDSMVATVFCDRIERYFSTDLFDDIDRVDSNDDAG